MANERASTAQEQREIIRLIQPTVALECERPMSLAYRVSADPGWGELMDLLALSKIAGVSGLAVGIAALAFRQVLAKKLDSGTQRLIVLAAWSIAIAGIGGWLVIEIGNRPTQPQISIKGDCNPVISGSSGVDAKTCTK